jgi:hypothetical protein
MIVVGLLGIATIVVVMWEKFNRPEYRTTRAGVFVSLVNKVLFKELKQLPNQNKPECILQSSI